MAYTLYAPQAGSRAFKILIAAEYNGVDLNVPEKFVMGVDNKTPEFLALNPLGKVPVLATPEGPIYESNAIARYVARLRADTGLTGKTFYESGQVDQWVDFVTNEMETPLAALLYPIFGYAKYNHDVHTKAIEDLKKSLHILENHLLLRTYFVGEQVTLADICVFGALLYPFKFICDKDFRKPFSNLSRWFSTVANQPEFAAIVGDVPLCDVATVAEGAPVKEVKKAAAPAKKEKKAAAPKDDEDDFEAPKEKKVEHPLAVLNRESPASMKLDDWKVCYSNTKDLSKAMEWLWANVDTKDYSFWFMKYNYNEENKKMFMTCNAVGGFIQRSDAMRKFSFGVMDVLGAEGGLIEIVGCWMFRGQSAEHMIEANPDAEYYTWTKVETLDDAAKARIAAYWCNEDDLEGKPIADGKVFK